MAYGREEVGMSENRMQKNSLLQNSLQIGRNEPSPDVPRFHVFTRLACEFGEIVGRSLGDWDGKEGLETREMICIDVVVVE